jgi:hypothetical protein
LGEGSCVFLGGGGGGGEGGKQNIQSWDCCPQMLDYEGSQIT